MLAAITPWGTLPVVFDLTDNHVTNDKQSDNVTNNANDNCNANENGYHVTNENDSHVANENDSYLPKF